MTPTSAMIDSRERPGARMPATSPPVRRTRAVTVALSLLAALFLQGAVSPSLQAADVEDVTFVAYNLKNYLPMGRRVDGEYRQDAPKPEIEIEALVHLLAGIKADILGFCEIGREEDLDNLADRLKKNGLSYPHRTLIHAADPVRGLALLSRFPIIETNHQTSLTYFIGKESMPVQRGILDALVEINDGYRLRLLGLHLKSKRPIPQADQALMRRNEAHLLRKHADAILDSDPNVNLLLYGDFNDTRNEPPIKAIQGRFGSDDYLRDVQLADEHGYRWTYYWRTADQYSRFDFLFVNEGLYPEVDLTNSRIASHKDWYTASDHRPLLLRLTPIDRKIPGK